MSKYIYIYTISLYDAPMKCKRQNHKSCKTHFRETSTLKNVKIASASFRDCSPVQVFDSYVQILHSEYDNIKNRNSHVNAILSITSRMLSLMLKKLFETSIFFPSILDEGCVMFLNTSEHDLLDSKGSCTGCFANRILIGWSIGFCHLNCDCNNYLELTCPHSLEIKNK